MKKALEVGVIGLGKFGMKFGETLVELGHSVIGVDMEPKHVRDAQERLTRVYEANAVEKTALLQLGFRELDAVAVSVGGSMETSILVTLNLQELGVKNIIAKAVSPAHAKVLSRVGAHRVIQPEADVATITAYRLSNPGMLDLLPVGGGVLVQELTVDTWEGKSLVDLNIRDGKGILVAAVCALGEKEYRFVPDPRKPFCKGDKLLVLGTPEAIAKLSV